jgi:hypothetical protein
MSITDADNILKELVLDRYKDLSGCDIKLKRGDLMNHAMDSEFSFFSRYTININYAALSLPVKEFTVCLANQLSKIVAFQHMSLSSKIKDMLFSRYSPSYFISQEKRAKTMTAERAKHIQGTMPNNQQNA